MSPPTETLWSWMTCTARCETSAAGGSARCDWKETATTETATTEKRLRQQVVTPPRALRTCFRAWSARTVSLYEPAPPPPPPRSAQHRGFGRKRLSLAGNGSLPPSHPLSSSSLCRLLQLSCSLPPVSVFPSLLSYLFCLVSISYYPSFPLCLPLLPLPPKAATAGVLGRRGVGHGARSLVVSSRRRGCHSAAPPSTFLRCLNRDGERESQ